MNRRRLVSAAIAAVVVMSCPAFGSVEGYWDVEGRLSARIKIKGFPAQRQVGLAADSFAFYPDGSFTLIDGGGTWTERRTRFTVALDQALIETLYEDMFADEGLNVDVTVKRAVLSGNSNRLGSQIRGTFVLNLILYVNNIGAPGTVNATYVFKGTRSVAEVARGETAPETSTPANGLAQVLLQSVRETVRGLKRHR